MTNAPETHDSKETYKVYLPPDVGRALRDAKAATRQSHSDIVAEALRAFLASGPPSNDRRPERIAG